MHRLLFLFAPAVLLAADPAGFVLWKSGDLKGMEKKLSPKIDAQKIATEQLGNYGNHAISISHREGSGQSELHEKVTDIFVVETGQANLVVGGKIAGGKNTAPGEVRGTGIDGGSKHALAAGDVVHMPANTPHQLLLDPGKQFTYFVIKVDVK